MNKCNCNFLFKKLELSLTKYTAVLKIHHYHARFSLILNLFHFFSYLNHHHQTNLYFHLFFDISITINLSLFSSLSLSLLSYLRVTRWQG